MKNFVLSITVLCLGGCAGSSSIPLSKNTFQLSTSAAALCGTSGAQKVAMRNAAIQTIQNGYDKFIIMNAQGRTHETLTGYTPVQAHNYGGYVSYTGGQPVVSRSHSQKMVVKMFKTGQRGSENALSAKGQLGPKWETLIKEKSVTCM